MGGGGTELQGFGTARYGSTLGPRANFRLYGKGFARDRTLLPNGLDATDDWHMGQGGFRLDWDASVSNRLTLQGDLYDGRSNQPSGGDIAISGKNVMAKWAHTVSANSDFGAQMYYDRTHRDIPGTFGEDLDIYDVDLQQRALLARHDVVWGVGYRLINDRVMNSPGLAFLPSHVARQWFTAFVQDEIALVAERLHVTLGTKVEHNDYTGFEIQPSGRVNCTVRPSGPPPKRVRGWPNGSTRCAICSVPAGSSSSAWLASAAAYFLAGGPNFHSEKELAYEVGYRHQAGALSLSLATFYSRYHGLRSLEQDSAPAPTPLVIANGQDGESYGAELAATYRLSDRWRLRGGYTDLRVHIWPNPGSTDTSRGATESNAPDRQLFVQSFVDLPAHLKLDGVFRYLSEIVTQQVPAYAELNARFSWQPVTAVELSIVGQNLLHNRHAEFGSPTTRRQIERGVYGMVQWHF